MGEGAAGMSGLEELPAQPSWQSPATRGHRQNETLARGTRALPTVLSKPHFQDVLFTLLEALAALLKITLMTAIKVVCASQGCPNTGPQTGGLTQSLVPTRPQPWPERDPDGRGLLRECGLFL